METVKFFEMGPASELTKGQPGADEELGEQQPE